MILRKTWRNRKQCVNALLRASLISTTTNSCSIHQPSCVNALLQASLISTDAQVISSKKVSDSVNALLRASLISTIISDYIGKTYTCVNALLRASLISTVPSGNPLFIRLPSLIFASNSQNILIIRFFHRFFWLVLFRLKILRYLPILLIRSHAI